MSETVYSSIDIGRAALRIAITHDRAEENEVKKQLAQNRILATAVDFGGEFVTSIVKIVERAVVAAQRQGLVQENNHVGAGAVAGATNAALEQIKMKAIGFNVGGKIGIARYDEHLCVAIYMGVGVLNLNEMGVGLAHRSIVRDN